MASPVVAGGAVYSGSYVLPQLVESETIDALNKLATTYLQNAQTLTAVGNFFKKGQLDGIATWAWKESAEEKQHGLKIFEYINQRQATSVVGALTAPQESWPSYVALFENLLAVITDQSQQLNALMHKVHTVHKDHTTYEFLQKILAEEAHDIDGLCVTVEKARAYVKLPSLIWHLNYELKKKAKKMTTFA